MYSKVIQCWGRGEKEIVSLRIYLHPKLLLEAEHMKCVTANHKSRLLKGFCGYLWSITSRGIAFRFTGEQMAAFVFRFVSLCYSGTVWIANWFQCTQVGFPLCVYTMYLSLGQPFRCVGCGVLLSSENTFNSRIHLRSTLCANETI